MLLLPELVVFASMVFLGLTSYADLRTGEIPDRLSYGYIAVLLVLSAYGSFLEGEASLFIESLTIGVGFFIAGFLMFYLGQWGGGDVKLVAGIGCALGFLNHVKYLPENAIPYYPYYLSYFTNMIFLAFPYAAAYGLMIGLKNPGTKEEFGRYLKQLKIRAVLIMSFAPSILAMSLHLPKLGIFYLLIPVMLFVALYLKAVEKTALQEERNVENLREGDVVAEDLMMGTQALARKRDIEGMSTEDIKKIQDLAAQGKIPEKIMIKRGIKFAPVLFLALLSAIYLGNLIEIITRFLI